MHFQHNITGHEPFDPLQSITAEEAQKAVQAINQYMLARAKDEKSYLHGLQGVRVKYLNGFYGFYYSRLTRIWHVEAWENHTISSRLFCENEKGQIIPYTGFIFLPNHLYPGEAQAPTADEPSDSQVAQEGGAA